MKRRVPTSWAGALAGWCLLLAGLLPVRADVRPSGMFSDNMVLQRNQPVPVWGWADPGESVTVEFGGLAKTAAADGRGVWCVALGPLQASAVPGELVIRGRNTVKFSGVLVGEVWLCAGQSNMAMALAEADGASEAMKEADPLLRAYRVPERPGERPWTNVDGQWVGFDHGSARQWAALPYFLARALRQALDVPVGVIVCAWGGSSAVSWMSPEILRSEAFRSLVPEEVIGWRSNIQPSRLYLGMLFPVVPYAVAGVAWYQGETDGEPSLNPALYRRLFPALIDDWRAAWRRPDLPFYWIQLPNLRNKDAWPVVREGQSAALTLSRTGMVPTIDIGQEKNLHPTNKREFAERLANLILSREYEKPGATGFPEFSGVSREAGMLRVRFRNADGGLKTTDGKAPLGFAVAKKEGAFAPAEARIDGDSVLLPEAEEVRYAWEGNPRVNLVNSANQPALPFRTDHFPVAGEVLLPRDLPRKTELPMRENGAVLARGESRLWTLRTEGVGPAELEKLRILRPEGNFCQMAIADVPRGTMTSPSPAVFWEAASFPRPENGLTIEVQIQVYRATDPFRGFDLEAILPDARGGFRRYRMAVVPMRVFAYGTKTILMLASNLDNTTGAHRYRMAVRPDGVAQVFLDGKILGAFDGEEAGAPGNGAPIVRVGKLIDRGEFTVNVFAVSLDPTGAFSSAP